MGFAPAASSARRAAVSADLGVVGAGAAAERGVVALGFSGASMEESALRRRGGSGPAAGTGTAAAALAAAAGAGHGGGSESLPWLENGQQNGY